MSKVKVILDIGNTQTKVGVFNRNEVSNYYVCSDTELIQNIASFKNAQVIISSVRSDDFTQVVLRSFTSPLILCMDTPIPIKNRYATPNTLGNDRLANAVAAWSVFPNQNNLIIDLGTCLKLDFINNNNEYIGGSISPGLKMRFNALNTFTDNLPLIEDVEINQLIGSNTKSSIQVGVFQGMIAELSNMISQYENKYKQLNILLTGGDASWFKDIELSQKNSIFADDLLTLRGLNTILEYNDKK